MACSVKRATETDSTPGNFFKFDSIAETQEPHVMPEMVRAVWTRGGGAAGNGFDDDDSGFEVSGSLMEDMTTGGDTVGGEPESERG